MMAVILDDGYIKDQVAADLTLNSDRPLLHITELQHARIDRHHAVAGEIGILADADRMARIPAVPIERRQHLVVQHKAGIESVGNAAERIQIQWHVEHTERGSCNCPWRELVGATDISGEIVVVLPLLERITAAGNELQRTGL